MHGVRIKEGAAGMKMALKDGQILIKEADNNQFLVIKSWGKMKWDKGQQMLYGPADIELLNRLAGLVRLPPPIEQQRQRMNRVAKAVDAERMKEEPEPLYKYPVKLPLYRHQVRGANMALMVFGLIDPPETGKEENNGKR